MVPVYWALSNEFDYSLNRPGSVQPLKEAIFQAGICCSFHRSYSTLLAVKQRSSSLEVVESFYNFLLEPDQVAFEWLYL